MGLTLGDVTYNTPLKDIPLPGEKITYDDLTIHSLLMKI